MSECGKVGSAAVDDPNISMTCTDVLNDLWEEWQERRAKMLAEKIDVTAFLTWMIENYPASAEEAKNAGADFWEKFR